MTSDRKLKASREGSKCRIYGTQRALSSETKVESETSQSKSGTSLNLSDSGDFDLLCGFLLISQPGERVDHDACMQALRSVHTNRPHSGGGRPLLREGGPISYEATPSGSFRPVPGMAFGVRGWGRVDDDFCIFLEVLDGSLASVMKQYDETL